MLAITLAACGGGGTEPAAAASTPDNTPAVTAPTPPANSAPVVQGDPALNAKVGERYSFSPTTTDAEHDALTFTITGQPSWTSFDPTTGALSGIPTDGSVGLSADIEIVVSDGKNQNSIGPFQINVAARDAPPPGANNPPSIAGSPAAFVVATQSYIFTPTARDADADPLSFSISNKPAWATFSTATGELKGTPSRTQTGTLSGIRITVSDGKTTAALTFSIEVQPAPNSAPEIQGTPGTSAPVGAAYLFKPTASDIDNNTTLTWSLASKPAWAAFSTTTGQLSGTPARGDIGTFAIRLSVSDGKLTTALPAFNIVVSNQGPTLQGTPSTNAQVGSAYTFAPVAADVNKDTLSFSITNKPSWATFSIATGRLTGTPTSAQVGTYSNIVISVSDGLVTTPLPSFAISVTTSGTANRAPTISGAPRTTANVDTAYSFTPSASDADGNTLTFSINTTPRWAAFSTTTGTLSGTPAAGDAGTTSPIVISVSDGKATVSLAAFSINVTAMATGSATVGWVPPTEYVDGSTLMNLSGYRIYYGTSSTNLDHVITITTAGVTSHVVDNLTPATWYFAVKAFTTDGAESSASNLASKTIK